MTWVYDQSSGEMKRNGKVLGVGYSGRDLAKNNPKMQNAKNLGPIPRGMWKITGVHDSPNTGKFTIVLLPEAGTETFGRGDFRIHGDSIKAPGTASHGCIILGRPFRNAIWESEDRSLEVVE